MAKIAACHWWLRRTLNARERSWGDRRNRRNRSVIARNRRNRKDPGVLRLAVWGELPEAAWRRIPPRDLSTPRQRFLEEAKSPWRSGRDDRRKKHRRDKRSVRLAGFRLPFWGVLPQPACPRIPPPHLSTPL